MITFLLLFMTSTAASFAGTAASPSQTLWQVPPETTIADWVWGPGGPEKAPRPPFRFLRENLSGTNPKVEVEDANGAKWIVKFGGEVHSETFAARILHATGYLAAPDYFVPSGVIGNVHGLKRARPFVSKEGRFRAARFRLRNADLKPVSGLNWSWRRNPFLGSRELNGLKILLMLLSNWDGKDDRDGAGSNTAVFADPSRPEIRHFAFTDWGATLGSWGGPLQHDRWDVGAYERQSRNFVRAGTDGTLHWAYRGKHNRDITAGISVEDVRWILRLLAGADYARLRAGLLASGATADHAERFARALQSRLDQLMRIVAGEQAVGQ
jgi:hypothetical protein